MSVQDIQFKDGETPEQLTKKLRALLEEVIRLDKRLSRSGAVLPLAAVTPAQVGWERVVIEGAVYYRPLYG
jgi:hypothetical protein